MLKGKTALITGASRGIGRAIAIKFAEQGAFVVINFLSNDKAAKEVLKIIEGKGGQGIIIKADVSKENDVDKMLNIIFKIRKNIDILVNNAGIYSRDYFENISKDNWYKSLSVNLTSCFHLCKKVVPNLKSGSKIIFMSSQLAFKGSSHGADYATTKAGMLGLMRSLAIELAHKKINVNAVAPGTIDTDLLANYTKEMKQVRINEIPLKRLGTPDDVADTCLFLASNLSDYITGETIHVNGGLYIH